MPETRAILWARRKRSSKRFFPHLQIVIELLQATQRQDPLVFVDKTIEGDDLDSLGISVPVEMVVSKVC